MQRTLTWAARAAVVGLLASSAIVAAAASAEAHASLLSSTPGDGAMMAQSPDAVVLRFDEPVDVGATAVRVYSGSGETVRVGRARADGNPSAAATEVQVVLPALPDDQYLARWDTTTSDDFHPVSGSFAFSVGVPLQPGFASSQGSGPPVGTAIEALLRMVGLLGLAGAVGGGVLLARLGHRLPAGDPALPRLVGWVRRSAALGSLALVALGLGLVARGSQSSVRARRGGLARCDRPALYLAPCRCPRPRRTVAEVAPTAWLGLCAAAWGVAALGHGGGRPAGGVPGSIVATVPRPGHVDVARWCSAPLRLGGPRRPRRRCVLGAERARRFRGGGRPCRGRFRGHRVAPRLRPRPVCRSTG